jgi:thiol-disulfide isomerase/thioredoxin
LEAAMPDRRLFLASFAAALAFSPAQAFEFHDYNDAAVKKAIASGKPVIVHVYASWCLQCHAQSHVLEGLKNDPAYQGISFFRVDYDGQKDVVKALNTPRATLIAYRGGKEVDRMSFDFGEEAVTKVLKASL